MEIVKNSNKYCGDFNKKIKIAVLITCHNRRETTILCLKSLFKNVLPNNVDLCVFLVDDGSDDGTAEAVSAAFPSVLIEYGDGTLFWNRGMHLAQQMAMARAPDFLLWLNDDTILHEDAVKKIIIAYEKASTFHGSCVIVGTTCDPYTGNITYGGSVSLSLLRRFSYKNVFDEINITECEVMNGNFVLIPTRIARIVGNLDFVFEHSMGDIDYALRVRRAGFKIFVAPGKVGFCSHNKKNGTYLDESLSFFSRWEKIISRKGIPFRSWLYFTRKNGSVIWPIYFLWPYFRFLISALFGIFRAVR